ncbi:MAG: hypothetical protein ABFS16_07400 [Bacteroidota bacterium]
MSIRFILLVVLLMGFTAQTSAGVSPQLIGQSTDKTDNIRLKNKIVPLTNPVYRLLEYFEAKGENGFIGMAKPYTRISVIRFLQALSNGENISEKERKIIGRYLSDLTPDTNGIGIFKQASEKAFVLAGVGAEASVRSGFGEHGAGSYSALVKAFFAGDLGEHVTFTTAIGAGVEQLAPDMFYQSYTHNGQVAFPYESFGYSWLPYQFQYPTNWVHYNHGLSPPIDDVIQLALLYNTELNSTWLNGAVEVNINNQLRSWGHKEKNLLLSGTARRMPALEFRMRPFNWFRYSFLVGSLYSLQMDHRPYKENIYGEDLGRPQKMLSVQMIELLPFPWLQFTGAANGIWAKRFEMAYFVPFIPPSLLQDNLGDNDNPSLYFDIATQFKGFGKAWFGFYVDDFGLTDSWEMLKYVRNKYAWQLGWKTNLLSALIPGTTTTVDYTRTTPFVYTHYPEYDFNMGDGRPIDMTYTHDGYNLGFYLPPNSGEFSLSMVNIAIPDLVLSLDNRFIIHGTNDLASENILQIYGDIYRHHKRDILDYPLLDFTSDGIYDYSLQSEIKFDWKIRTEGSPRYYRLNGSLGYSKTWWESNESQVVAPPARTLFTGSLGVIIEI